MPETLINRVSLHFTIFYGGIIVVLLCCLGLMQTISRANVEDAYLIAFTLALALGLAHVKVLHTRFNMETGNYFTRTLLITVLLLTISMLLIAIGYFYLQLNFLFLTFLPGFLIPFMGYWVYRYYLLIPDSEFKLSFYPFDWEFPDISTIDFSQTVMVNFVLEKELNSGDQTSFTTRAPLNMPVSELFFTFIYEYNKNNPSNIIRFMSGNNEPYLWLFHVRKGVLQNKHFLDPNLSFRENGVKPDQHIYAARQ